MKKAFANVIDIFMLAWYRVSGVFICFLEDFDDGKAALRLLWWKIFFKKELEQAYLKAEKEIGFTKKLGRKPTALAVG